MFQRRVGSQDGIVRFNNGRGYLRNNNNKRKQRQLPWGHSHLGISKLVKIPEERDRRKTAIYSFCRNRPTGVPSAAK